MRVARLLATGAPDDGPQNLYVTTDQQIELGMTPVYKDGTEFEQENGCGSVCVEYRDCDRFKRLDLTLSICTPDPEMTELLVGNGERIIKHGGTHNLDTIGYAYPEVGHGCPNGVSIEGWTKAIIDGAQDADFPYIRWVLGRTFWRVGDRTLSNGVLVTNFVGFSNENPLFLNGPANDWPYVSNRNLQYAYDTALPVGSCGLTTMAAS